MYLAAYIGPNTGAVGSFMSLDSRKPFKQKSFPIGEDFASDYRQFLAACHEVMGEEPIESIEAMGLVLAGMISRDRSRLTGSGSLRHWWGKPIESMLRRDLKCHRIRLGNDAEAAALYEALFGFGQGHEFWYVFWGYGIGGCLVLRHEDGTPHLLPSELGHQKLDPYAQDTECGCGEPGCLESIAGLWSLTQPGELWPSLTFDQWDEKARWVEIGVHNVLVTLPRPFVVIFGGELAVGHPELISRIRDRLRAPGGLTDHPTVFLAIPQEDAEEDTRMLGALALLGQRE